MTTQRSFPLRGTFFVVGAAWGGILLNYAFHFTLSRRIAPEDYGAISSLIALLSLLTIPSAIATAMATKTFAELQAVGDRDGLIALSAAGMRRLSYLAIAGFGGLVLFDAPVASYLHESDRGTIDVFAVIVATNVLMPPLAGALQGLRKFEIAGVASLLEPLGKAVLAVGLVLAGFGERGAVVGYAAGSVAGLAVGTVALGRIVGPGRRPLGATLVRRLRGFGGAAAISTTAFAAMSSLDIVLARHFLGALDAARFAGVGLLGKFVLFGINAFPPIVLAYVAHNRARSVAGDSTFRVTFAVAGALGAVSVATAFAFPHLLIALTLGPAFAAAAPLLGPYMLAMSLLALATLAATFRLAESDYGFAFPLALVAVAETCAICLRHESAATIVTIVTAGHGVALLALLRRSAAARALAPALT